MERVHLARAPQKLRIYFLLLEGKLEQAVSKSNDVCGYDPDRDFVYEKRANQNQYVYTAREDWLNSWTRTLSTWASCAGATVDTPRETEGLRESLLLAGVVPGRWNTGMMNGVIHYENLGSSTFAIGARITEDITEKTIREALVKVVNFVESCTR